MPKKFCLTCTKDRQIISSHKGRYHLSCGHNVIEKNLDENIKLTGTFTLRLHGKGEKNEKFKQGNKPPNINYAKKFIEYGNIDYEAAIVLFNIQNRNDDFMNQAAFLCAQAIEKYLKAFLFWYSPKHYPNLSGKQVLSKFRKLSHDLVKILNECVKDNNQLDQFRTLITNINKYSLLKYPDVEDEMVYSSDGLTISSNILKDVKTIANFIKPLIK